MLLKSDEKKLLVKKGKDLVYIDKNDILYIEKMNGSVIIHMCNEKILINSTLKEMENLMGSKFFRSHKSFLVNLEKVSKIKAVGNKSYQAEFKQSRKQAILSRHRYDYFIESLIGVK